MKFVEIFNKVPIRMSSNIDLVLIATLMASEGFPVPSFVASSKEYYNDKNLLSAIKDLTSPIHKRTP